MTQMMGWVSLLTAVCGLGVVSALERTLYCCADAMDERALAPVCPAGLALLGDRPRGGVGDAVVGRIVPDAGAAARGPRASEVC